MTLQHLRSSTANKRPTPAAMSDGQLAMNTNLASPGLFLKDSNGDLVKIGPVHVGTTAPNATPAVGGQAGNSKGEQWLDTTGGVYVFKIYDGTAWRSETGTFVDVNGDTMTGALGIIAGSAAAPGVFFAGDTNTGIYSPGADQVAVATNGTEKLIVKSGGEIGIGTSSPNYQLHVTTAFAVGASGFNQQLTFGNDTIQSLLLGTGYTALKLNPLGGNVGIGNSSPGAKLDVSGSGNLVRLGDGTNTFDVRFQGPNNWSTQLDTSADKFNIQRNSTSLVTVDSAGRLGIGTTAPNRKLEVSDASADNFIRVNTTGATKSGIEFASGGTVYSQMYFNNVAPYDLSLLQQYTTGSLILGTNSTERARIDSSGRLLVGTSSDSGGALFQVNGDRIRVGTAKTPATSGATGTTGEIAWDANYIYVCTATNTWKRTAIATW